MNNLFTPVIDSLNMSGQSGLFSQKRINEIKTIDTFAAKKTENELEALLIQLDSQLLTGIEEWPRSEGFEVILRPGDASSALKTRVCLELCSAQYREVFHALCEDICKVLAEATDANNAVRGLHLRLYRWQEFLKRNRPDGLSPEEQTGLFGELTILQQLFLKHLQPVQGIDGWRGYKKAPQDFQYPDFAMEVKTTRAVTPDQVQISNIQQLDDEGIKTMILTIVWVNQNATVGSTLPDIIDDIRESLPYPAIEQFNEGLIEVGYLDIHQYLYDKQLYQVKEVMHFEVRDGFPRITRDQIPEGIRNIKYQISIDRCKPFSIDTSNIILMIKDILTEQQNG
jgi:hypothetical protein